MNESSEPTPASSTAHRRASLPRVVIVGRPNVGKSSLLNMLAGRRIAIVDPTAGVTRDRISAKVTLPSGADDSHPRTIELVDTGGFGIKDTQDLTAEVERQIAHGLEGASLVMFAIDGQTGVTPLDEEVAEMLRRSVGKTPVVVLANKVDDTKLEPGGYEAAQLGLGDPVLVSATTKHNLDQLYDLIREHVTFEGEPGSGEEVSWGRVDGEVRRDEAAGIVVALVGKRNAGKSTMVNSLVGEPRVIVSEVEGTTRDSVDVRVEMGEQTFTLIDTAGLRRRKSIADDIEYYSHHRSLRSVRRADVVLMLIDASVPISQVDRQLGNEILKHYKPTVLVVNKWDLAEKKYTESEYVEYLDEAMKGFSFAPIVFASGLQGEGLRELLGMAANLYEQAGHRETTGQLNQTVRKIIESRPPRSKLGKAAKIFYVTQIEVHPPTIGMWVNDPDLFDPTYQRFLLNNLRDELPFSEVPIKLAIRPRGHRHADEK